MDNTEERFKQFLHDKGLKFTPERQVVLEEAFAIHDHFEAEDLLLKIRQNNRRVSRGTIYRTLNLLVESGLVRKVAFIDKHTHYEHVYGHTHHEHLICLGCGQVIEFYRESLEQSLIKVCEENKFNIKSHKVEVLGYCRECDILRAD
jgi:Fur family ferric uptake transcriptional regulator